MSSLYIHIPFCDHICSYCDFCKVFYNEDWADKYLEALAFEIEDKKINQQFDTIYIGGGTPTSLSEKQLDILFKMIEPFSSKVKEYSIEVNPENMNENKMKMFSQYGITRLSIGSQSFDNDILKNIDRCHNADDVYSLVEMARTYNINDINIDLMYGLPNQKLEDVLNDIERIADMNISHVSIYALILENHTKLKNINYKPLDDEEDALWYDTIIDALEKKGYKHYEVSNFYKDKPSLHNLVYWHYEDYYGIGVSAHSLVNNHRLENTRRLNRYFEHRYLDDDVLLSEKDQLFETIMMGLRLKEGLDIQKINSKFNIDFKEKYKDVIKKYLDLKCVEMDENSFKPTQLGFKYLNNLLIDFFD